ncbi:MAG: DUF5678 domain-containing protein [bacterium]|nr:DUF5678 domain-containing protein [bacterium]
MSIDWTKIYKKYKGLWVALKSDEKTVIASGLTAQDVWKKAVNSGVKEPILTFLPKKLATYVGFGL